jgi:hypothetical protein
VRALRLRLPAVQSTPASTPVSSTGSSSSEKDLAGGRPGATVPDPLVREAADAYQGRLIVVRADITRCPGPVRRYAVTGAPAFVLIDRGEATAARNGPMSRTGLGEFLDMHL